MSEASLNQRRRDDNKNKICTLEGGGGLGAKSKHRPKTLLFVGNATTIKFAPLLSIGRQRVGEF